MADLTNSLAAAKSAINTEIAALVILAQTLEENLKPALEILVETKGHVVVTGLGKSGLWSMIYGLWSMVYGLWSMVYGL